MYDSNNHKVPNAESIWPICENELNLGKHSSLLSQHGDKLNERLFLVYQYIYL